jgi:hypothetical protein
MHLNYYLYSLNFFLLVYLIVVVAFAPSGLINLSVALQDNKRGAHQLIRPKGLCIALAMQSRRLAYFLAKLYLKQGLLCRGGRQTTILNLNFIYINF